MSRKKTDKNVRAPRNKSKQLHPIQHYGHVFQNPDILFEIISLLDAISIINLLSVSSLLWKLRENDRFIKRVHPYIEIIKNKKWRVGILAAVDLHHIPQLQYFQQKIIYDPYASDRTVLEMWNNGLCCAIECGHRDLVDYFIHKGANEFNEAMQYAAIGGHRDLIELCISKGANQFTWGLQGAARGGHLELVDFFISRGAEEALGGTLPAAVEGGNIEVVKLLLAKFRYGHYFRTRATKVAIQKRQKEIVRLIANGDLNYNEAMEECARAGFRDLVDLFIEKGATSWNEGMRAAFEGGQKELVKFFSQHKGVSKDVGLREAALRNDRELVDFFVEQGSNNWNMGLCGAAHGGHRELVEWFVEKGSEDWNKALKEATIGGHKDLVEYFIMQGAYNVTEGLECAAREGNLANFLLSQSKIKLHNKS